MSLVYLYKYREYVGLTQDNRNVPNINLPMIIYDTKVYKGVTNYIDFQIRNNDRKTISMVGFTLTAQIQAVDNPTDSKLPPPVLLEKTVQMVDDTAGKARLTLNPEDVDDWNTGYYRYTIRTVDPNGVEELLFTDINKDTWASFELREGIAASLTPATEISAKEFTPVSTGWNPGPAYTRWYTGALVGDAQASRASGTHTIVIYTNNWQGKIWVEGSLSNNPPLVNEWFPIQIGSNKDYLEITSTNIIGPYLVNFSMNLYWIRISYQSNPQNVGVFNKILYKN